MITINFLSSDSKIAIHNSNIWFNEIISFCPHTKWKCFILHKLKIKFVSFEKSSSNSCVIPLLSEISVSNSKVKQHKTWLLQRWSDHSRNPFQYWPIAVIFMLWVKCQPLAEVVMIFIHFPALEPRCWTVLLMTESQLQGYLLWTFFFRAPKTCNRKLSTEQRLDLNVATELAQLMARDKYQSRW